MRKDNRNSPTGTDIQKKENLGLVLSGGGARGIAHIGILKALEELNIKPDVISGTSSGAAIGAFYSAGYSSSQIEDIILNNKFFHLLDLAWNSSGFLTTKANEKMFRRYFKHKSFSNLNIPLYVSATDILKGKSVFFSSGDVVKVILGSSALPIVFEPVKYKKHLLLDGSMISCFPIEPLVGKCKFIIGSYVNPINKIKKISGMLNVFDRAFHLTLYNDVRLKKNHCDVFLEPPELINYTIFDFKKVKELVDIGYKYTLKQRKKLILFQS